MRSGGTSPGGYGLVGCWWYEAKCRKMKNWQSLNIALEHTVTITPIIKSTLHRTNHVFHIYVNSSIEKCTHNFPVVLIAGN